MIPAVPIKQLTLRLPAELHRRLKLAAYRQNTTIQRLAREGIELRLKGKEKS